MTTLSSFRCTFNSELSPIDVATPVCGKPASSFMYEPDDTDQCSLSCHRHAARSALMFEPMIPGHPTFVAATALDQLAPDARAALDELAAVDAIRIQAEGGR